MFSAVYLWEIYFLEACHFFVEGHDWGFCLMVGGVGAAGDRNAKAKHRSLAKENKLSLKKTHT